MKFKVNTLDIQQALDRCKTTVSLKDAKPVLRNFCLQVADNKLSIMATDLELATVCTIPVFDAEDGAITLPAIKLFSAVALGSSEFLEFELIGETAHIVIGNFNMDLQGLAATEFPTLEEFHEASPITMERELFLTNLNRISFSISDNEARKNLLAVFINAGYIQASDGHVSSLCKFSDQVNNVLIPSLAVPDLVRVLKASKADNIEIANSDSWLLFKVGDDLFSTRLSQAKFPDIPNKILKPANGNNINIVFEKADLEAAVRRVAVTSDSSSLAINLAFSADKCTISSIDGDGNKSVEIVDCKNSEDIEFMLNYQYVLDFIKSINGDKIDMKASVNPRMPIKIHDGDFITLLMTLAKKQSVATV